MNKKDEFDSSGEAREYISLDQAVLEARRMARQDDDHHRQRLGSDQIVWTELSSDRREDSYRVVLQFRAPAHRWQREQTGQEEFIFDLNGNLLERQVLAWPAVSRPSRIPAALRSVPRLPTPRDVFQTIKKRGKKLPPGSGDTTER